MSISQRRPRVSALLCLAGACAARQTTPAPRGGIEERTMSDRASGTFDVTIEQEPPYFAGPAQTLTRVKLKKTFHGELEATSSAEMLAATTASPETGCYVAIERVVGVLNGRAGSFLLLHRGTMGGGAMTLQVDVVEDSGTDELQGIAGSMAIEIAGKVHRYRLDYTLAPR